MKSGLPPMVPAARLPGHGVFRTALDLLSDTAGWLTASDYRTLTGRGNLLLLAADGTIGRANAWVLSIRPKDTVPAETK